jgi:hypothetical protein
LVDVSVTLLTEILLDALLDTMTTTRMSPEAHAPVVVRVNDVPLLVDPVARHVESRPIARKLAVMVPVAAMVAVVVADVELAKVIEPLLDCQFTNLFPELAVAVIDRPELSHTFVPDGFVEPDPETAKVIWNCL